jgi:uncharacterized protein YecT (DUF1311 family)
MKKTILILTLSYVSFSSQAQINNCDNLSTQTEINKCSSLNLENRNKEIGNLYNKYLLELNAEQKTSLKESQRLWVQFKERDCAFEASSLKGGSMYSYSLSTCLIDRTEKRISELKNMMNCKNGTEPNCF